MSDEERMESGGEGRVSTNWRERKGTACNEAMRKVLATEAGRRRY